MYNNDNDNNENNQCQKFPGITFFFGILIKINILLWKKTVLYTTTLMHYKAGKVLRDLPRKRL